MFSTGWKYASIKETPQFMEQTFYKKDSETSGKNSAAPKIVFSFVILFILAVGVIIGLYIIGANKRKELASVVTHLPMPRQVLSPTPTPLASVSASLSLTPSGGLPRNLLRVAVLNGSGTPGAAQGTSAFLQKAGYAVISVTNAERFDYRNLTVYVKTSKKQYLPQLKKDLESYSGVGAVTASVSATIVSDVEVIVGR
jgi:hypothetical protein